MHVHISQEIILFSEVTSFFHQIIQVLLLLLLLHLPSRLEQSCRQAVLPLSALACSPNSPHRLQYTHTQEMDWERKKERQNKRKLNRNDKVNNKVHK